MHLKTVIGAILRYSDCLPLEINVDRESTKHREMRAAASKAAVTQIPNHSWEHTIMLQVHPCEIISPQWPLARSLNWLDQSLSAKIPHPQERLVAQGVR